MKCMSCNADIPPQWVKAIQSNICPGCGEQIMNEASKELLDELRGAISRMPNDAEGLAGWILSNYELRKVGDAEPVNFHRKSSKKQTEDEEVSEMKLKIANNPVQQFLKRTNVEKQVTASKQSALAKLAQKIKSGAIEEEGQFEPTEEESEPEEDNEEYTGEVPIKLSSALATVDPESVAADPEVKAVLSKRWAEADKQDGGNYIDFTQKERVRRQQDMLSGQTRTGKGGFSRGD
jgi:hypothetical protein